MKLPPNFRETAKLRLLGLFKIPLLFFISPSIVELSDDHVVVNVPLVRRTKNHLGSMYFAVLAAGADCAGGLIAWRLMEKENAKMKGKKLALIFKDFHADFHQRAEGDVHFTCTDGQAITELVTRAAASGERENMPVRITATVPSKSGSEPVANFTLTLSIKAK